MLANGQHLRDSSIISLGNTTTVPRNIPPVKGVVVDWQPRADKHGTVHSPNQYTISDSARDGLLVGCSIPPVKGVQIDWQPGQADRHGTVHNIPTQEQVDQINETWRAKHWSV